MDYKKKNLNEQGTFNGTVLVAEAGKVIYQKGFSYANMDTKERLTPKSVFRLASVSKQFTAMCIMMLKEQSKLNYDDVIKIMAKHHPEREFEPGERLNTATPDMCC